MGELIHDPTFWVAVAFVIFVVAVFKPIRGAMLGGLDAKIAEIRQEVEEAEKLRGFYSEKGSRLVFNDEDGEDSIEISTGDGAHVTDRTTQGARK